MTTSTITALTLDAKIALASAVAAIASALYTWRTYSVTKKALRLAKLDFDERHDDIRPYLIDATIWNSKSGDKMISFACSFANNANAPNTISKLELILHLYDPSGISSRVILDPISTNSALPWDLQVIKTPLNLKPRTTESGWVSFKIPPHVTANKSVDRYEIVGIESLGKRVSLEAYIPRSIELE